MIAHQIIDIEAEADREPIDIQDPWYGYQPFTLKFVVIFDDYGNYTIHGNSTQNSGEMFKAMSPLWDFDPKTEMAQFMEIEAKLPRISKIKKPYVANDK